MKLLELKLKEEAVIKKVAHPDEQMNQRLLDLGFYPGGRVKMVLISPKNDAEAYEVRGTVIAIRNDDAKYIEVEVEE